MSHKKSALLIGATGLVGGALLGQLLDDPDYGQVTVFARRSTGRSHAKLVEHVVDFGQMNTWASLVQGDIAFSALGTTRGQVGSSAAQRVVDYDYQYNFAKIAASNGVGSYLLVSSGAANPDSAAAYLKMKGELDRNVALLPFERIHILRPGPLNGPREKPRVLERMGVSIVGAFNAIGLFMQYRPITGEQVARVMRLAAQLPGKPAQVHEPDDLFRILASK
jgi:uncharacterized protein YbjT (DUF2867 family)